MAKAPIRWSHLALWTASRYAAGSDSHPVAEVAGQVDPHIGPNADSGLRQVRTGSEQEVRPIRKCGRVGDLKSEPILGIRDLAGVVECGPSLRRETQVERDVGGRGNRPDGVRRRPSGRHGVVAIRARCGVSSPKGFAWGWDTGRTARRGNDVPAALHEEGPSRIQARSVQVRWLSGLVPKDAVERIGE